jgi:selenium metabolism protein YedF
MTTIVDARGLACPQPVLETGKAIAADDAVTVIVDDEGAAENVGRFARSRGFSVAVSGDGGAIRLELRREGPPPAGADASPAGDARCAPRRQAGGGPLLFVASDALGRGPAELGERLMGAFFTTLLEASPRPATVVLMNTGVRLAAEGSRALDELRALAGGGTDILACGTCLGYFELTGKLAVGRVSNIHEIATLLMEADRVVSL